MTEESDRREEILEAALEEFSSKGFRGATIKSIAKAAGIQSPALIYWYFQGGKEELLQAVLARHAPVIQALRHPETLMERPPEEVLPMIARAYLATANSPIPQRLARLVIGEALRRPEVADMVAKRGAVRGLWFLKTYLEHQVELGRLRPHDTRSSARALIGMFVPQAVGDAFLPALKESDGLTDEEHIGTSIGIFLRGLRPEGITAEGAEKAWGVVE
ncbi:MAG: TetR/AcrR family transcriptional regulator [Chloroflexota bacterium]|nr:TetR/AcrR family transcriptional regulator [Chloroflexota bacterium]